MRTLQPLIVSLPSSASSTLSACLLHVCTSLYSLQSTFNPVSYLRPTQPQDRVIRGVKSHTLPRCQFFTEKRKRTGEPCPQQIYSAVKELWFNHDFWRWVQESLPQAKRLYVQWLDAWAVKFGQTRLWNLPLQLPSCVMLGKWLALSVTPIFSIIKQGYW